MRELLPLSLFFSLSLNCADGICTIYLILFWIFSTDGNCYSKSSSKLLVTLSINTVWWYQEICARDACTNSLYYIPMDFVQQAVAQSNDSDFFLRHLCWRRLPRRAFVLRRGTPTCSGFSRPAGVIVGVDFLAEPLSSVEARQHSPDFPGSSVSLLASTSSQSLCLPSRHANMLRFFSVCRKPRSVADRHNGKSFGRYGGFFFSRI